MMANLRKIIYENNEAVILTRMNRLRGLFAILIVLGHCGRRFDEEQILLAIPHYGAYIWVCFFLMISGWSMAYNYDNKESYLYQFGRRKILKLCFLVLETELVTKVVQVCFLKERIFVSLDLLADINWYIYEILALYVVFWVAYTVFKEDVWKRNFVILVFSLSIAIVTWVMYRYGSWEGWTYAFYFSTLSFPLGIYIHTMWKSIMGHKDKIFVVCVLGAIMGVSCLLLPKESLVGGLILHNFLGLCAMLILVLVIGFFDVNFRIVDYLTKNATYIYLYQFGVMSVMSSIYVYYDRPIDGLYVCTVVVLTIIIATLIRNLNMGLRKMIYMRKR